MPIRRSPNPDPPSASEVTLSEHDGVRFLHLDSPWVQGAMWMAKPQVLVLEYIQRMMAWLLFKPLRPGADAHAVQFGLGAAAITRFTHGVMKLKATTAVEINPQVIQVCRQHFRLPRNSARLNVLQGDAAAWAADISNAQTADVLCVDVYDHDAAGPVLDDAAFYRACHQVLADGGVMSVNLFGRLSRFDASLARLMAAFGDTQVWRLTPTREGNAIVIAARGIAPPTRAVLREHADVIEHEYGLPARKWLKMLKPAAA